MGHYPFKTRDWKFLGTFLVLGSFSLIPFLIVSNVVQAYDLRDNEEVLLPLFKKINKNIRPLNKLISRSGCRFLSPSKELLVCKSKRSPTKPVFFFLHSSEGDRVEFYRLKKLKVANPLKKKATGKMELHLLPHKIRKIPFSITNWPFSLSFPKDSLVFPDKDCTVDWSDLEKGSTLTCHLKGAHNREISTIKWQF